MAFLTAQNVIDRLGSTVALELTTDSGSTPDSTWAACAGAEMSMVGYQLHLRRPPVPEDWTKANDEAVAWLTALAEGKVPLPDASLNAGADWGSQAQNAAKIREDW